MNIELLSKDEEAIELFNMLKAGKINARPLSSIKAMTGYSRRRITNILQRLRIYGVPVCSCNNSPGGYFIATNVCELTDYMNRLSKLKSGIEDTLFNLRDVYIEMLNKVDDDFME